MRLDVVLATFLFQGLALSHYTFPHLILNGTVTGEYEYVRRVDRADPAAPNSLEYPQITLGSLNETCGRGAWRYAKDTLTATVEAGSEVGFRTMLREVMFHTGPGFMYLSKVPEGVEVEDHTGHGEEDRWTKIAYEGPKTDHEWSINRWRDWNINIPATTPPGKYLLRISHYQIESALRGGEEGLQLYVNCAQLNIVGPGGGKLPANLQFPGSYHTGGPGMVLTKDQGGWYDTDAKVWHDTTDLMSYQPPGGPVWTG